MAQILKIDVGDHRKLEGQIDKLLRDAWEQGVKADFTSVILPQKKEVATVQSSYRAIKRSLMGFDKLNRLVARSSGSSKSKKEEEATAVGTLAERWKELWAQLDQSQQQGAAVSSVLGGLSGMVSGAAAQTEGFRTQLEQLQPSSDQALAAVDSFKSGVLGLNGTLGNADAAARNARKGIEGAFHGLDAWFNTTVESPIKSAAGSMWDQMSPGARAAWSDVKSVFSDASTYFTNTFGGAWRSVKAAFSGGGEVFEGITGGVLSGFKKIVNKLIDGVNKVVAEPFSGLNALFDKLRKFTFEGKTPFSGMAFGVTIPVIPKLASGAVLPANRPFMAVVGDQKHGTNIEAPLSTIQEAMSTVMGDFVEADMAGHNATVQVLRQILEAVLGISLDEGTLARAVERHQGKMAVVTGGF